jgi:hypothetical protein
MTFTFRNYSPTIAELVCVMMMIGIEKASFRRPRAHMTCGGDLKFDSFRHGGLSVFVCHVTFFDDLAF